MPRTGHQGATGEEAAARSELPGRTLCTRLAGVDRAFLARFGPVITYMSGYDTL
jgi:hypothetical protein